MGWARLLRRALERIVNGAVTEVLKTLTGSPFDLAAVELMISQNERDLVEAVTGLTTDAVTRRAPVGQLISANPDFLPLRAMLEERRASVANAIRGYKFLVNESAIRSEQVKIAIGRRGQDILRETTLRLMKKGWLAGNPRQMLSQKLVDKINRRGIGVDENVTQAELAEIHGLIGERIPIMQKTNAAGEPIGAARFYLRNKNGRFMSFEPQYYADLVARTTTEEAVETATEIRARQMGTRFVKFNRMGKDYTDDPKCAAVDGNVFSLVSETSKNGFQGAIGNSGKFYIYLPEILGDFKKPHPFCKHIRTPYPERLA